MARMRERRVLFSDAAWDLVKAEAERTGVSANQFLREASVFYAAYLAAGRGDTQLEAVHELVRELRD